MTYFDEHSSRISVGCVSAEQGGEEGEQLRLIGAAEQRQDNGGDTNIGRSHESGERPKRKIQHSAHTGSTAAYATAAPPRKGTPMRHPQTAPGTVRRLPGPDEQHGFREVDYFDITPVHAVTHGRK